MSRNLCKMKHFFYVNDGTYRFWENGVLGNVDINMLVVVVMVVSRTIGRRYISHPRSISTVDVDDWFK